MSKKKYENISHHATQWKIVLLTWSVVVSTTELTKRLLRPRMLIVLFINLFASCLPCLVLAYRINWETKLHTQLIKVHCYISMENWHKKNWSNHVYYKVLLFGFHQCPLLVKYSNIKQMTQTLLYFFFMFTGIYRVDVRIEAIIANWLYVIDKFWFIWIQKGVC